MQEKLFQFIWQHQYFNHSELRTVQGDILQILNPGVINHHQGPDFKDARIKINDTLWAGNIELHICSSDWDAHKHTLDLHYNNIILHVVWVHDREVEDSTGVKLPTLELQSRVSGILLSRFQMLMDNNEFIPCSKQLNNVTDITLSAWKNRLLIERLQEKAEQVFKLLKVSNNHWEETFWWLFARNFGIRQNADVFESIARTIPLTVLGRHKSQLLQIEAILFGQAGLLEQDFVEQYPGMLKKEYHFLKNKYKLPDQPLHLNFLRMRPANFPTVRLAQLAAFIHQSSHLFSTILEIQSVAELEKLLFVSANDYWHYHYILDEESPFHVKKMGKQMVENIIINTISPVLFAYGKFNRNEKLMDRAIRWLEEVSGEQNAITKGFAQLGLQSKTSFDSQAFIQLKNNYCNKSRCLECSIGNSIIKSI